MSNEKTPILLAVRGTTQESLREMRARVFSIVSTAITLFTVFIGWFVQRSAKTSRPETLLFKGRHFQKFELVLSCSAIASILMVILKYIY